MKGGDRLPPPRRRTGDPDLDRRILELLNQVGADHDVDQLFEIVASAARLAGDQAERLDLKITNAALKEMRQAFSVFAPYREVPKVTVFGSARTRPDDPLYSQACELARSLAGAGWMVVTGAGPGIMAAAVEGAGVDRSIGVNIRLPFEQGPTSLESDPKHVVMKYFFTRKLMLMKESAGFAVLPGGFGTLDEVFELLTLLQTGKATPAPIVLLDVPGGGYWHAWDRFIRAEVVGRGMAHPADLHLCRITDDVATAVAEIRAFYRNYHSVRWVGSRLVVRLKAAPSDHELAVLNRTFADICAQGDIAVSGPLPPEVTDDDHVDLPRLVLAFDGQSYGRLRALVDAVNTFASSPPLALPHPDSAQAAASVPDEVDEGDHGGQ